MGTKHMNAEKGDFAATVLMPGDPLRAKYIAEKFLTEPKLVTDVRNMFGFTGRFKDRELSIMAHGMGIPSASIYCSELIEYYGVERIIRVGSCGTVSAAVKLRDIIIGLGASTDSKVNRLRFGGHDLAAIASFDLVRAAVRCAEQRDYRYHVGALFSADLFYTPEPEMFDLMAKYGILAVEMEAAGIYAIAAEHDVQALAMCTVSDDIPSGEALTSDERQTTFDEMIEIALETALAAEN